MYVEIMVRVSPEVVGQVDELVKSGRYDSRADFCRTATIHMLRDIRGESIAREIVGESSEHYYTFWGVFGSFGRGPKQGFFSFRG